MGGCGGVGTGVRGRGVGSGTGGRGIGGRGIGGLGRGTGVGVSVSLSGVVGIGPMVARHMLATTFSKYIASRLIRRCSSSNARWTLSSISTRVARA